MKSGWQTKTLGDLFKVGSSKRVLKSQWKNEGIPFYRGREITRLAADGFVENELFISNEHYSELAAKYGVPSAGDIVITAIGTIGNSHLVRVDDKFYFKDASVLWLAKSADVSSEFVNLWLKSTLFFSQLDTGNGATVDTLTIQKLQGVQLSLPPLPEQQRIVAILDEAFEGIAAAAANAEKNLKNARELYAGACISVFQKDGEGWLNQPLDNVCIVERGSSPRPIKEFFTTAPNGVNWIKIGDTEEGEKYVHSTAQKITPEGAAQSRKVNEGDLILTNSMSYGRPYIMKIQGYIHDGWFVLRPKPFIDTEYFYHLLASPLVQDQFSQLAAGAVVKNISGDLVKKAILPIPPIDVQRSIVYELESLSLQTKQLEVLYQQKLDALAELKKSILHQAFTGQLH
jgi:type I restriction enzyme S subunit